MGEIADYMSTGELCSVCGVYLEPGEQVHLETGEIVFMSENGDNFGVPVICNFCHENTDEE